MFQKVRQLFRENIMKHRGIQVPNKEDDGSQPSDVLDSDIEDGQVSLKNISLIEVQFGTQSVYVLNYLRKILLCAEDQTVEFIRNWLVPLAKETILLVAAQRNNEPTPPLLQSQESVVYSCTTNKFPNIAHKVQWMTDDHEWKVTTRRDKKKEKTSFPVNSQLKGKEYEEEKLLQYRLAILHWNDNDHTKGHRIPVHWVLETKPHADSSDSQTNEPESQSSSAAHL